MRELSVVKLLLENGADINAKDNVSTELEGDVIVVVFDDDDDTNGDDYDDDENDNDNN